MARQWDNAQTIVQDLSVAQGRAVPAPTCHIVAQDERPPRLVCPEENFYIDYIGGGEDAGEYNSGPDIPLIQKMLHELKQSSEEETITITKKPVKQKNLAIASLIEMRDNPSSEDLQNGLFTAQSSSSHTVSPIFNTVDMFKKKKKKSLESRTSDNSPTSVQSDAESTAPRVFVPSARAAEFYSKYLQHTRAERRARETVWTRAQSQMMEIDERRKMSAMSPGAASSRSETTAQGMDLVRLATPRHSFTDAHDCVVCQVLTKKDTQVKTETK